MSAVLRLLKGSFKLLDLGLGNLVRELALRISLVLIWSVDKVFYHHRVKEINTTKCTGNERIDWMTCSWQVDHGSPANVRENPSFTELN